MAIGRVGSRERGEKNGREWKGVEESGREWKRVEESGRDWKRVEKVE